ncbi:MAG: hypothetical protein ABIQ90_10200 [Polaromonas sp.]
MTISMMSRPTLDKWILRLVTALLWTLAAASIVYWGLRLTGRSEVVAVPAARTVVADAGPARQGAIARLLGEQPAAAAANHTPEAAQRFALLGVIASVTGQGAALISVDGEPPRPMVVGAQIAPGYVLKSVNRREAVLTDNAQQPARIVLTLPLEATADSNQPAAFIATPPPAALAARSPAPQVAASAPSAVAPTPVAPASGPNPNFRPSARQDPRGP